MKKFLLILCFIVFIIQVPIYSAYDEPELFVDKIGFIVVGEKVKVNWAIDNPAGSSKKGFFIIRGTTPGKSISFKGPTKKVRYKYYFPNGGWQYRKKSFKIKVSTAVVELTSINGPDEAYHDKTVTFSCNTNPAGYETHIEWKAVKDGSIPQPSIDFWTGSVVVYYNNLRNKNKIPGSSTYTIQGPVRLTAGHPLKLSDFFISPLYAASPSSFSAKLEKWITHKIIAKLKSLKVFKTINIFGFKVEGLLMVPAEGVYKEAIKLKGSASPTENAKLVKGNFTIEKSDRSTEDISVPPNQICYIWLIPSTLENKINNAKIKLKSKKVDIQSEQQNVSGVISTLP